MKAKKKIEEKDSSQNKVSEPLPSYSVQKNRIRFSSIEDQGDILLEHSLSLTPAERLYLMFELNGRVFKRDHDKPYIRPKRIIFTRYEYSPE